MPDGTKTKTLTKEELGNVIDEHLKAQLSSRAVEMTDEIKGIVKEAVEETLNHITPPKKTPFGDGTEDPKGGFTCEAEFCKAIYDAGEGMVNPNHKLASWLDKSIAIEKTVGSPAQSTGSLQSGGALIPPEFSMLALAKAKERSSIMQRAKVVPMSTLTLDIPYIKDFDNSQGYVAGNVKFRNVSETAQATGSDIEFSLITLNLREANCMIYVSNKMMKFSPVSIQPFITTAVDDALDIYLANQFFNGTGAGEALGIINAPALVSVAKETSQLADTILYENTLKMLARSYGNGQWWANKTIIPQIGVMELAVGTGGSAVFVASDGGVQSASGKFLQTLHGMPINYEQVVPILGDAGDLTYADWSQYLIGQFTGQQGLEQTDSAHLKFDYRQHAFQFTFWVDGQPWWPQAFVPRRGDSISPFVTTAVRA